MLWIWLGIQISAAESSSSNSQNSVDWTRCYPPNISEEAFCTTIEVPLNHQEPDGETVPLYAVKLPSVRANTDATPLFVLAGGPGQGASEVIAQTLPTLQKIHQQRTLIFLDQRGTGKSEPLHCEIEDSLSEDLPLEALKECVETLPHEPKWYRTEYLAKDTDFVREALGYETINLYGVSYGTRLGLEIIRQSPSHVSAAVLDGVAPSMIPIGGDFGMAAQRALQAVFDDCAQDQACQERFPTLSEEYNAVLERLSQNEGVDIQLPHPRTGAMTDYHLSQELFWGALQQMLYDSMISSMIPFVISSAAQDNWRPLIGWVDMDAFGSIPIGLYLSIICAEDVPQIDYSVLREANLGVKSTLDLREMCAVWPTESDANWIPAHSDVQSDVPTLLLSGAFDPVTPPSNGDRALSTLSNGHHVVVSGMAHNTMRSKCVFDLVEHFINNPQNPDWEISCAGEQERSPFILSTAGMAP